MRYAFYSVLIGLQLAGLALITYVFATSFPLNVASDGILLLLVYGPFIVLGELVLCATNIAIARGGHGKPWLLGVPLLPFLATLLMVLSPIIADRFFPHVYKPSDQAAPTDWDFPTSKPEDDNRLRPRVAPLNGAE